MGACAAGGGCPRVLSARRSGVGLRDMLSVAFRIQQPLFVSDQNKHDGNDFSQESRKTGPSAHAMLPAFLFYAYSTCAGASRLDIVEVRWCFCCTNFLLARIILLSAGFHNTVRISCMILFGFGYLQDTDVLVRTRALVLVLGWAEIMVKEVPPLSIEPCACLLRDYDRGLSSWSIKNC